MGLREDVNRIMETARRLQAENPEKYNGVSGTIAAYRLAYGIHEDCREMEQYCAEQVAEREQPSVSRETLDLIIQ